MIDQWRDLQTAHEATVAGLKILAILRSCGTESLGVVRKRISEGDKYFTPVVLFRRIQCQFQFGVRWPGTRISVRGAHGFPPPQFARSMIRCEEWKLRSAKTRALRP